MYEHHCNIHIKGKVGHTVTGMYEHHCNIHIKGKVGHTVTGMYEHHCNIHIKGKVGHRHVQAPLDVLDHSCNKHK